MYRETTMSTRLKIDLSLGAIEVEGEEAFVQHVYDDFRERLMTQHRAEATPAPQEKERTGEGPAVGTGLARYDTLAECITAAGPRTDAEYALVAGAYLQEKEGLKEITGLPVNKALTHTGHGVGNITDALQSNIDSTPQYVIQIAKSGKSKQARKKYKVTDAGFAEVERMIVATATHATAAQSG
jgi:hypothetical protein